MMSLLIFLSFASASPFTKINKFLLDAFDGSLLDSMTFKRCGFSGFFINFVRRWSLLWSVAVNIFGCGWTFFFFLFFKVIFLGFVHSLLLLSLPEIYFSYHIGWLGQALKPYLAHFIVQLNYFLGRISLHQLEWKSTKFYDKWSW